MKENGRLYVGIDLLDRARRVGMGRDSAYERNTIAQSGFGGLSIRSSYLKTTFIDLMDNDHKLDIKKYRYNNN